jgi:carbon storage regulator CsrA
LGKPLNGERLWGVTIARTAVRKGYPQMLVLSRRVNEKVLFPSINVAVQVVGVRNGLVRLGIDAPPEVKVLRGELRPQEAEQPPPAGRAPPGRLSDLVGKRLRVAQAGLAELQRQLEAGRTGEAEATLAKLDEDLRLLQRRIEARPEETAPAPPRRGYCATALLVEDNPGERELLALLLRRSGLNVDTGGDGTDALDYLHHRGRPDVVLLDMGLPRCDGATMVRAVRKDPALAGLKIFAVSGHGPEEFDLARGPAGVDRWFHKPVDPDVLLHDVNEELDRGRRA